MILNHYDALFALADQGSLAGRVFDSVRFDGDENLVYDQYLILYHNAPAVISERFTLPPTLDATLDLEFDARAIGTTARAAAATMQAFHARVLGRRLTVTGRECTPIGVGVSGGRVAVDRSVNPPLYYMDSSVTFVSRAS